MSTPEQQLEAILRQRGLSWALDLFHPSSDAASFYIDRLAQLTDFYVRDRNLGPISFSPESLKQLVSVSPYKADAFLQALVSIRTVPILCAAWRIIQGVEIKSVEMQYERLLSFCLSVVLRSPDGELERYDSEDVNDMVFLRHLSKSTVDTKPLFDNFYALRQT